MPGTSIVAANGAIEVGHKGVALMSSGVGCATTWFCALAALATAAISCVHVLPFYFEQAGLRRCRVMSGCSGLITAPNPCLAHAWCCAAGPVWWDAGGAGDPQEGQERADAGACATEAATAGGCCPVSSRTCSRARRFIFVSLNMPCLLLWPCSCHLCCPVLLPCTCHVCCSAISAALAHVSFLGPAPLLTPSLLPWPCFLAHAMCAALALFPCSGVRCQDPGAAAASRPDGAAPEHHHQLLHNGAEEPGDAAAPVHAGAGGRRAAHHCTSYRCVGVYGDRAGVQRLKDAAGPAMFLMQACRGVAYSGQSTCVQKHDALCNTSRNTQHWKACCAMPVACKSCSS